jgi:hypothetical protein
MTDQVFLLLRRSMMLRLGCETTCSLYSIVTISGQGKHLVKQTFETDR